MHIDPATPSPRSIVALFVRIRTGADLQGLVVDLLPGAVFLLPRHELVEDARRAGARARGLEVARADEAVLVPMHEDRPPTGVVEPDAVRHLRRGPDVDVDLDDLARRPVRMHVLGILHGHADLIL